VATTEYRRFTIDDANAGLASGWTFASGWFRYQSSWWAWFSRAVAE
jgi:hypothetical protein